VVQTPLGTIGINICADNFPNSLVFGHSLARNGRAALAVALRLGHAAGATTTARNPTGNCGKTAYSTLTKLYDLMVVGVSNVGWLRGGPWRGYKCIGCSLAMGPGGVILAEAPYGEAAESLMVVEVEPVERTVTGAAIAGMLAGKGYDGP